MRRCARRWFNTSKRCSTIYPLARALVSTYYRLRFAGASVPARGPVLLVANHPNSLLDPMVVLAAAKRQVRFLAKAPLWQDPKTAWLVKIGKAIPVYRASDDPNQMGKNAEMFLAVHTALAAGDAVGLFPEGISHSEPSLTPIKTGAARIALGAAALTGAAFPIIPVGLVFRKKDVFRSDALALVGSELAWDDLATRGEGDADAVRELTDRIERALRQITVNLEQWEDQPLLDCAMKVWEAELRIKPSAAARVARLNTATRVLALVRASPDADTQLLLRDVGVHQRRLARLGLRPSDLVADVGALRTGAWATRRLPLVLPLLATLAVAGWLLFAVPYLVTRTVIGRLPLRLDTRSTSKLLIGAAIYATWLIMLTIIAWIWFGWGVSALTAVMIPMVGMLGLLVRERWRGAWADVRRWTLLHSRRSMVETLRSSQHELAQRLDRLLETYRRDAERRTQSAER